MRGSEQTISSLCVMDWGVRFWAYLVVVVVIVVVVQSKQVVGGSWGEAFFLSNKT